MATYDRRRSDAPVERRACTPCHCAARTNDTAQLGKRLRRTDDRQPADGTQGCGFDAAGSRRAPRQGRGGRPRRHALSQPRRSRSMRLAARRAVGSGRCGKVGAARKTPSGVEGARDCRGGFAGGGIADDGDRDARAGGTGDGLTRRAPRPIIEKIEQPRPRKQPAQARPPFPSTTARWRSHRGPADKRRRWPPPGDRSRRGPRALWRRPRRSDSARRRMRRPPRGRQHSARASVLPLPPLEIVAPARLARSAPRTRGALEDDDVVGRADEGGVGQARRAGAEHGDALAPWRTAIGMVDLTAGLGIDKAMQRSAAAHAADTGVAGNAAADGHAGSDLSRPVGVGEQGTAERYEITGSIGEGGLGDGRFSQPTDGDHRDGKARLQGARKFEEGRVRPRHRRYHARSVRQRAVVAGGNVHRIGAMPGGPRGNA